MSYTECVEFLEELTKIIKSHSKKPVTPESQKQATDILIYIHRIFPALTSHLLKYHPEPFITTTPSFFIDSKLETPTNPNPFDSGNPNPFTPSNPNPFISSNHNPFTPNNPNPFIPSNLNPFTPSNSNPFASDPFTPSIPNPFAQKTSTLTDK